MITIYNFDFNDSDICCEEDMKFEDKKHGEEFIIQCDPGDPVFMSDSDYNIVKTEFIEKIKVLNSIYFKIKFPFQIGVYK